MSTCGDTCDRKLDCGLHRCSHRCHTGNCESVSKSYFYVFHLNNHPFFVSVDKLLWNGVDVVWKKKCYRVAKNTFVKQNVLVCVHVVNIHANVRYGENITYYLIQTFVFNFSVIFDKISVVMEIVYHVKQYAVKHLIVAIINVLVNVIVAHVIRVRIKLMLLVHVDKHQSLFHVVVKNKLENHAVTNYACTFSLPFPWCLFINVVFEIGNHQIVIIQNVNRIYAILMSVRIVNNNVICHLKIVPIHVQQSVTIQC